MRRVVIWTMVVLLAVALVLPTLAIFAGATEPTEATDSLDLTITAHRGAPTKGVGENTIEAFDNALAAGATAIETDVRRTKDDKMVILHDSGVGRTTNCAGPIPAWTLAQLDKQCREKSSGKPLPHFDEVLRWVKKNKGVSLMVEPKGKSWTPTQLARFVSEIKDSGVMDRVAVSSLRADHLVRIRRLAPKLHTQLIVTGWPKVRATRGMVGGYNIPARALTKDKVKALHKRGLVVIGGLSDGERDWRRAQNLRLDGVVVSTVRDYTRWAASQGH